MRHLDLFSGIGGFALAATWVWGDEYENVGHSEIESYPCKVYHRHFPESECLGDITRIDWTRFTGTIDLVTGGFPCQPHSIAGRRRGKRDDRYLWPTMLEAIRQVNPQWVVVENVCGIDDETDKVLDTVCDDLESIGYEVAPPFEIPACFVGAAHKRCRIWVIANANSIGMEGCSAKQIQGIANLSIRQTGFVFPNWRKVVDTFEPKLCRSLHGLPAGVDRIKGLGNAIVPQCAAVIMEAIKEATQ